METRTGNTVLKLSDKITGELICKHCGRISWAIQKPSAGRFVKGTFSKCPFCGIQANTIYEGVEA